MKGLKIEKKMDTCGIRTHDLRVSNATLYSIQLSKCVATNSSLNRVLYRPFSAFYDSSARHTLQSERVQLWPDVELLTQL